MPDEEEVSQHVDIAQTLQLGRAVVNLQTKAFLGISFILVADDCLRGRAKACKHHG